MVPIPTTDAPHVMEVFRVHADEMIIESIISPRQQDCPLSYRVNAMTQKCLPSRRIDRISYTASNFVRCRCRGSNEEICLLTGLFAISLKTNSATGLLQILPWHTNRIFTAILKVLLLFESKVTPPVCYR